MRTSGRRDDEEDAGRAEAAPERGAEDEAARSQQQIEAGGITVAAERRLTELREGGSLFTSALPVSEFAMAGHAGVRPLSQVMGSSIYHVGWQPNPGWSSTSLRTWDSQELTVLSRAWNEARRRALVRLREEAWLVGADAVVGVHITKGEHDWASGAIEFIAIGTAVRTDGAEPGRDPVLTDLSVQDYWKLVWSGYRPLGVVAATTSYYVVASWRTQRATMGWSSSWVNQELTDFTRGLYDAREIALGHLTAQAESLGAAGVVGVGIEQEQRTQDVDTGAGPSRKDLVVTFHVMGTAIAAPVDERALPTDLAVSLSRPPTRPRKGAR